MPPARPASSLSTDSVNSVSSEPSTSVQTPSDEIFTPALEQQMVAYWQASTESSSSEASMSAERDVIVATVTPYVERIAKGLARRSNDPVDDLIQVGLIGLLKAIEKFSPLKGARFKTYATYCITGEVRHYLRDKTALIKAPRQLYELYYRMNLMAQDLQQRLGRTPTDEDLANALECSMEQVHQVHQVDRRRHIVSIEQQLETDEADGYAEKLMDDSYDDMVEQQETRLLLAPAFKRLPEDLQEVLQLRYGDDLSQVHIAEKLGISQMQVSRRLKRATGKLATWLTVTELNNSAYNNE